MSGRKKNRAFTLIELLVVIAIIGILAGIVLANLSTSRQKARAASAKETMQSMRATAELLRDSNGVLRGDTGSAVALCSLSSGSIPGTGSAAPVEWRKLTSALAALGVTFTGIFGAPGATVGCACDTGPCLIPASLPRAWGYAATLPDGTIFCVDNAGFAGVSSALSAGHEISHSESPRDVKCDNQ